MNKRKTPKSYVNVEEAAKLLGVTVNAIRSMVQKRQIPFYKPNKNLRFDPDELLECWAKSYVPATERPHGSGQDETV